MIEITKVMKYEIAYNKNIYELLNDIQDSIWKVKNKTVTLAYDFHQFSNSYFQEYEGYPKSPKESFGKTLQSDIYLKVKKIASFVYSGIVNAASREAFSLIKREIHEVLLGLKVLPNFKKDGSFPLRAPQITNLVKISDKRYEAKLALLSKEGAKERNLNTRHFVTLLTGMGANNILNRIIDGEYKLRDSRISKKKNKYYLEIAYQMKVAPVNKDVTKIMGIDLGISNAVYMAFNFDDYLRYFIKGNEIIHFRQRVEARRKSILGHSKYAGQGRRGRGRSTLLKPIEKFQKKIESFGKNANHKYSKYIIDMAEKHGCGTIQIEDLKGIIKQENFLKNWSYYELQIFIMNKAKEKGIIVKKINPRY